MSKKSNFKHQYMKGLQAQVRYGQNKHEKKAEHRQQAKEQNKSYEQVKGLYSTRSFDDYSKVCSQFSAYVIKEHPDCKNYYDAKEYVSEWLSKKQEKGLSAWSLHKYGSALASSYGCSKKDFNFEYPARQRGDVIRCRGENGSDYRNTNPRFNDVKDFIRGTGARRIGLIRLCKDDIRQRDDGRCEVHLREKNGMERWSIVLPKYEDTVLRLFNESKGYKVNDETRLFRKCDIPLGSIHDLRGEYAKELYNYFEERDMGNGVLYHCRKDMFGEVYDKRIMQLVSEQLGHHRLDVVTTYLKK